MVVVIEGSGDLTDDTFREGKKEKGPHPGSKKSREGKEENDDAKDHVVGAFLVLHTSDVEYVKNINLATWNSK